MKHDCLIAFKNEVFVHNFRCPDQSLIFSDLHDRFRNNDSPIFLISLTSFDAKTLPNDLLNDCSLGVTKQFTGVARINISF